MQPWQSPFRKVKVVLARSKGAVSPRPGQQLPGCLLREAPRGWLRPPCSRNRVLLGAGALPACRERFTAKGEELPTGRGAPPAPWRGFGLGPVLSTRTPLTRALGLQEASREGETSSQNRSKGWERGRMGCGGAAASSRSLSPCAEDLNEERLFLTATR